MKYESLNFSKLSLRGKLIFLLCTAVLLAITIGVINRLSTIKLMAYNDIKHEILSIKSDFDEIRKSEKDFLFVDTNNTDFFEKGTSTNTSSIQKNLDLLKKRVIKLQNNGSVDNTLINATLDSLLIQLNGYERTFTSLKNTILSRGYKDYGTIGDMRNAIHQLESFLTNHTGLNSFKVHMLMLRRHEKDYLLREDLSYYQKFDQEFNDFRLAISGSLLTQTEKKELSRMLDEYKEHFENVIDKDRIIGIHQENKLLGQLQSYSNTIQPQIEMMEVRLDDNLSGKEKQMRNLTISILIGGLIICVLLFLIINSEIYRSIGGEPTEVAEIVDKVSSGDLSVKLNENKISGLYANMNSMVNQLNEIVSNVLNTSNNIVLSGGEVTKLCESITEGSQKQLLHSNEVTGYVREMVQTINGNVDRTKTSDEMAKELLEEIEKGQESVNKTRRAMMDITGKITIINEIAQQTNILSINASVEAARAGKDGKGFSTIASEVRKLAEGAHDAALEIEKISNLGISIANETSELFDSLMTSVKNTVVIVEEIGTATKEQNGRALKINDSIDLVNDVIQSNSKSLERIVSTIHLLNSHATKLDQTIGFFNTKRI